MTFGFPVVYVKNRNKIIMETHKHHNIIIHTYSRHVDTSWHFSIVLFNHHKKWKTVTNQYQKGKPINVDETGNFEKGVGFNFFHKIVLCISPCFNLSSCDKVDHWCNITVDSSGSQGKKYPSTVRRCWSLLYFKLCELTKMQIHRTSFDYLINPVFQYNIDLLLHLNILWTEM